MPYKLFSTSLDVWATKKESLLAKQMEIIEGKVNDFLKEHPGAVVDWKQSTGRSTHLTAIIWY